MNDNTMNLYALRNEFTQMRNEMGDTLLLNKLFDSLTIKERNAKLRLIATMMDMDTFKDNMDRMEPNMVTRGEVTKWIKNGGATISSNGTPVVFDSGYQVAQASLNAIVDASDVGGICNAIRERLVTVNNENRNAYIGLWINNGKAYIDISYYIKDKARAIEVGKLEQQISIWCWHHNDCLYL